MIYKILSNPKHAMVLSFYMQIITKIFEVIFFNRRYDIDSISFDAFSLVCLSCCFDLK